MLKKIFTSVARHTPKVLTNKFPQAFFIKKSLFVPIFQARFSSMPHGMPKPENLSEEDKYFFEGLEHSAAGNLTKAKECLEKSYAIVVKARGEADPKASVICSQLAAFNKLMGNIPESIEYCQKIIKALVGTEREISYELSIAYQMLGETYMEQGKLRESLEMTKKALDITYEIAGEDNQQTVLIYNQMGKLYDQLGDLKKAIKAKEFMLEILVRNYKANKNILNTPQEDLRAIAHTYIQIADNYLAGAEYKSSKENFLRAETYLKKLKLEECADLWAIFYTKSGFLDESLELPDDALANYEKAIKLYKEHNISNPTEAYALYTRLGNLLYAKEEYQSALNYFLEGILISRNTRGENDPSLIIHLADIASCYQKLGKPELAEEYRKQISVFENKNANNPALPNIFRAAAATCRLRNELQEALDYYQKSIDYSLEKNSLTTAQAYSSMGHIAWDLERYEDSLNFYKKSIEIQESSAEKDESQMIQTYAVIGHIQEKLGNRKEALKYTDKTISLCEKLGAYPHIYHFYNIKVGLLLEEGDNYVDEALDFATKAYEGTKTGIESETAHIFISACRYIADIWIRKENHQKGEFYIKEAIEVTKKYYGEDHESLVYDYEALKGLYTIMGKPEEAKKYEELMQRALRGNQ